jgi:hypothetical protein
MPTVAAAAIDYLDSDTQYQWYCQQGIFPKPAEMSEFWAYKEIDLVNYYINCTQIAGKLLRCSDSRMHEILLQTYTFTLLSLKLLS